MMMRRSGVLGIALVLVTAGRAEAQGAGAVQPLRAATEAPAQAASAVLRDSVAALGARVPAGGKRKGEATAGVATETAAARGAAPAGTARPRTAAPPPPPAPAARPAKRRSGTSAAGTSAAGTSRPGTPPGI
jgi:hypothetical protein